MDLVEAVVLSPLKSKSAEKFLAKSYPSHIDLETQEDDYVRNIVHTSTPLVVRFHLYTSWHGNRALYRVVYTPSGAVLVPLLS